MASSSESHGVLSSNWGDFYATRTDDLGKPHLRTYSVPQAEKFFQTSTLPLVPARQGRAAPPPSKESLTWGVGGTLPHGRFHGKPAPAGEFQNSQKRYIPEKRSQETVFKKDTGAKMHVFDESGDRHDKRSESYVLESMLQRKAKVPEEMRVDHRTIHRMAPPGLKGYMGAEYSNDFFARPKEPEQAAAVVSQTLKKTFKQKRAEEEVIYDRGLVHQELAAIPLETGDGEVDSDDEVLAEADKVYAD
mmetsp:Transcript_42070/g.84466  ORF Transcript_42070/g.84466 Transcript_42070/m.84466 type:complete len:247 (-) Transcript_42070:67-807(-)